MPSIGTWEQRRPFVQKNVHLEGVSGVFTSLAPQEPFYRKSSGHRSASPEICIDKYKEAPKGTALQPCLKNGTIGTKA